MKLEPSLNQKILIQTGPDLQLIAYNLDGEKVHERASKQQSKKQGTSIIFDPEQEKMVDVFSLKVLALLMGRGAIKEKANLFMDLVIGRERLQEGADSVVINDPRLMRVIREIIYFSEIFPKQYSSYFKRELQLSHDLGKVVSTDHS